MKKTIVSIIAIFASYILLVSCSQQYITLYGPLNTDGFWPSNGFLPPGGVLPGEFVVDYEFGTETAISGVKQALRKSPGDEQDDILKRIAEIIEKLKQLVAECIKQMEETGKKCDASLSDDIADWKKIAEDFFNVYDRLQIEKVVPLTNPPPDDLQSRLETLFGGDFSTSGDFWSSLRVLGFAKVEDYSFVGIDTNSGRPFFNVWYEELSGEEEVKSGNYCPLFGSVPLFIDVETKWIGCVQFGRFYAREGNT